MPSKKILKQELTKLSINYPAAKRGADEVDVLVDVWADDLEDLGDAEFKDAVKQARKHSTFFPTSADVLKHAEEMRSKPQQHSGATELPQTPSRISEEERERNKQRAREIREKVAASSRLQ